MNIYRVLSGGEDFDENIAYITEISMASAWSYLTEQAGYEPTAIQSITLLGMVLVGPGK